MEKAEIGLKNQEQINVQEHTVFKYSKDIPLAEEVTLGDLGRNVFLQIIEGKPRISHMIDMSQEKHVIIKPHNQGTASPALPYQFKDVAEIEYFIEQAQKETVDSLFVKHKSIWKQIVVASDDGLIILLASDSVYSYFQDKFATTHYDMFVGGPGSGKGAILNGFRYLGYRVVLASDMSGANILDLLSSVESNQITLAEDEFGDIYKDPDKLKIVKVGYDDSAVIPRTLDGNTSNRSSRYFFAYCFKVFAAEESPDTERLDGFKDRTFKTNTIKGKPSVYVKELSKPNGSQKYQKLLARIQYLRKLTFVYRLLHHNEIFGMVNTNIEGRALELTGPQIRLFNSDNLASKDKSALKEILPVLSSYLRAKGEISSMTLESKVYMSILNLFSNCEKATAAITDYKNGEPIQTTSLSIPYDDIYQTVRQTVNADPIQGEQAFYSVDHGKVTHRKILNLCRDKFKAKDGWIGSGNDKKRALVFDQNTILRVGKSFEIIDHIEILEKEVDVDLIDDPEDKLVWREWNDEHQARKQDNTDGSGTEERNLVHIEDKDAENDSNFSVDSVVDDPINRSTCTSANPSITQSNNANEPYKNSQNNVNISQSEFTSEDDNISSTQGRPLENQKTTDIISYSDPNSVPPSHRVQRTDQRCLTIDNDSDKQATDREGIVYTGEDKIEKSLSSKEIVTTSDENAIHRQNADAVGSSVHSLSPHISQQESEKGVSNSVIRGSARHIRRLYEGSDIRVCVDCGRKGDRWEMEEHNCNGR
ncbi:MAG: hypothetical protein WBP64_18580 [Nitrososphaeraceae archaeon]